MFLHWPGFRFDHFDRLFRSDIVDDPASSDLLLTLFVFNRTFFMGFFFLISGYFLDASLARHGAWGVAKPRLVRLGIPMFLIVVFVFRTIGYLLYGFTILLLECKQGHFV